MTDFYVQAFENMAKSEGASEEQVIQISAQLDFQPPTDYFEFLKYTNGAEGFLTEHQYLSLWKLEDLMEYNRMYHTEEFAPGYFIFGSDGGGTAFAFKKDRGSIFSFEFIGMTMDDEEIYLANSFKGFLQVLIAKNE